MSGVSNRTLLILLLSVLLCPSCSREADAPVRQTDRLAWTAPQWGAQVDGVRCRLRPTQRLWQSGDVPTFKLDLHNQGKRLFAFDVGEPIRPDRVAVDGRWYYRRRDEMRQARVRPLAPGVELSDLVLIVPASVALPLGPSRHTIEIALHLEDLTVLSNPVGIEIADPPARGHAGNR